MIFLWFLCFFMIIFFYDFFNDFFMIFYDFFYDFLWFFWLYLCLHPSSKKTQRSSKNLQATNTCRRGTGARLQAPTDLLQTAAKVLKPYQAHLQCPTGFEPKAQISQIWAAISKFAFSINLHQCSSGPCKFPHCRLQDFFFLLKLQRKNIKKPD